MADMKRSLKIKTGTLGRLGKEVVGYKKELLEQEQRIEKMRAESKDEYDIKKQQEVLQETRDIIPDSVRRLESARNDLKEHMDLIKTSSPELVESQEWKDAETALLT